MNYLELCKAVARKTGTVSGGAGSITTVQGTLPPRVEKIAGWVAEAWTNIQNERSDWAWMQAEFTAPLIIGQARYEGDDLSLSRVATWACDSTARLPFSLWDPAIGQADEGQIVEIDYECWRERYQRGAHDASRPTEYALAPSGEIVFGPTPDKAYVLRGEYRRTPQALAVDIDVPEMPVRFHNLIVVEAIRILSNDDDAPQSGIGATGDDIVLKSRLCAEQLPKIGIGSYALA